jgi:arginyl-tRNA synthetase
MNLLSGLQARFSKSLSSVVDHPEEYLGMIRPAQDDRFGDYQANFAMPLSKKLEKPARAVAEEIVARTDFGDLCSSAEVAGPGFINLRISDETICRALSQAFVDDRLGVQPVNPKRIVVDFSSPNVAKPMHVGHIRSTVIGDSLARVARFLGHDVITDNHLGDWGTQFGMIIYGYKHFRDDSEYQSNPVRHLGELYRLVRRLVDYQESLAGLPELKAQRAKLDEQLAATQATPEPADKGAKKKRSQEIQRLQNKIAEMAETIASTQAKIEAVEQDSQLNAMATAHPQIHRAVLEETARLHAGDAENLRLWNEFLPYCREDIQRIYDRLGVKFDHELGESFFHDRLNDVVKDFEARGLSSISDGAVCVFLDGFEAPMLIQKSDGAYLYATTDLATIQYRMTEWHPDIILYVVDHRQHEHFDKLFAAARKWGFEKVDLRHVSFGTVLGQDGKPYKTRAGDTVGLEGLLDEAEQRALAVLEALPAGEGGMSAEDRVRVSKVVGIGALKFADLSQHRASDYTFSYDKMLELKGFTATYLQYLYARVQGIFRKAGLQATDLRQSPKEFVFAADIERQLAMQLVRFPEALEDVLVDYRPNLLAQYLFELAKTFFKFYDQCPVIDAEDPAIRSSRLQYCDLTGRTVARGLDLLGIGVVEKM